MDEAAGGWGLGIRGQGSAGGGEGTGGDGSPVSSAAAEDLGHPGVVCSLPYRL